MASVRRRRQKTTSRKLGRHLKPTRERHGRGERRRTNCRLSSRVDAVKLDYRRTQDESPPAAPPPANSVTYRLTLVVGVCPGQLLETHSAIT